jgi:hypothetical protein
LDNLLTFESLPFLLNCPPFQTTRICTVKPVASPLRLRAVTMPVSNSYIYRSFATSWQSLAQNEQAGLKTAALKINKHDT